MIALRAHYTPISTRTHAGTSCVVNTATRSTWGVVRVSVAAATPRDDIIHRALLAVTRSRLTSYNQLPDAMRVRWFHELFFRVPPTIVLEAAERMRDEGYAAISASCRALVGLGFRIVVDASHNAISEEATAKKREDVLDLDLMPRELVEQLTGLDELHASLSTLRG